MSTHNDVSLDRRDSVDFRCHWSTCSQQCSDAEALFEHICETHIGRKATNNLNLVCKWPQCKVRTSRRDHMTSHIRAHVSFRPYACSQCEKTFKRLGDVKRHELTHEDKSTLPTLKTRRRNSKASVTNGIQYSDGVVPLIPFWAFTGYSNGSRPGSNLWAPHTSYESSPTVATPNVSLIYHNNQSCRTAIGYPSYNLHHPLQYGPDSLLLPRRHAYTVFNTQTLMVQGIPVQGLVATDYVQFDSEIIHSKIAHAFGFPALRDQYVLPPILDLRRGSYPSV